MPNTRFPRLRLLVAATAAACAATVQAGDFENLGTLGGTASRAYGVSGDGSVVVGYSHTGGTAYHAFRWTSSGMVDLGTLGGTTSYANGVSSDGSVVVGYSYTGTANHAFRWTSSGGMVDLGTLGGSRSEAFGASSDGSVVVGYSETGTANHAFRWTSSGGMADLGTLGGTDSYARGASADGSVVVGYSKTASAAEHAFRWTSSGGMVDLGTLGTSSAAYGVSSDGSVVVGESYTGTAYRAFRWTSSGGMVDLGALGGAYTYARGVSSDGSVVVGYSYNGTTYRAFRWTQATGMQSVSDWLSAAGVSVPSGWTLEYAQGASSDGSVVVGYGTLSGVNRAWLARVSSTGSGVINSSAYNATLIEAGARAAQAGAILPGLALFGAHHRSLLDSGLVRKVGGACAWATADAGRNDPSDTDTQIAEAGVCKDVGSMRLGIGVGSAYAKQDWSLGGSAKYDGQYLIAHAANIFGNGLEGSVVGYYGRFGTELRRNYENGSAINTSTGKPDATSTALRLRLDWRDIAEAGQFSLSPYAVYTWTQTKLDGYTETGGGFPAIYGASKWEVNDLRGGVAARTGLSSRTNLRLAGEVAHRFDDSTNGVNGQAIGLWDFSLPGEKVKQSWARVTIDVDRRLSDTSLVTFGASAASSGGDASWGLTAGWRMSF